MSLMLML